jgi:hypothetical protein
MSDKRLFDVDPLTGQTQWFIANDGDETFTIQTTQDVSDIVEFNKAQFNEFSGSKERWGEEIGGRTKVASIPTNIYYDLLKRFGRDQAAWKRWLNDPDNAAFRTRPGMV